MAVPIPRAPAWLMFGGLAGWAAFTVIAVVLTQESDGKLWVDVLAKAATVAAGVGAATAIGGGVLGWWQHRTFQQRTRWIAYNLMQRTMRSLARIAAQTRQVILTVTRLEEFEAPDWETDVFDFPFSATKERQIAELIALLADQERIAAASSTAEVDALTEDNARAAVLNRQLADLHQQATSFWSTAAELSSYLDEAGPALLTDASHLVDSVLDLSEPMPGVDVGPEFMPLFSYIEAPRVLTWCASVANKLDAARTDLGRRTDLGDLEGGINATEPLPLRTGPASPDAAADTSRH